MIIAVNNRDYNFKGIIDYDFGHNHAALLADKCCFQPYYGPFNLKNY